MNTLNEKTNTWSAMEIIGSKESGENIERIGGDGFLLSEVDVAVLEKMCIEKNVPYTIIDLHRIIIHTGPIFSWERQ